MKKFLFMFALLMSVMCMNAQKAVETSKFTDNMSITLQGGVVTPFNDLFKNGSTTPIVVLGVDKYINPWFGVGVESRTSIGTGSNYNPHTMFDVVNVSGYAKFNLVNLFNTTVAYDTPGHLFEPVIYTGLGWGHTNCTGYTNTSLGTHVDAQRDYMTYRIGAELNFNLTENRSWAVVVNPSVVWGDICNGRLDKRHGNFEVTTGVVYRFVNHNGTRNFVVHDITALNSEINKLRAHKCPNVPDRIIEKIVEKTINKSYVVTFAFDSYELNDRAKKELDMIPTNSIVNIEASASPEGDVDHNLKLSQNRANSVKEYLENRGITVKNADGVGVYDDASGRQATITIL